MSAPDLNLTLVEAGGDVPHRDALSAVLGRSVAELDWWRSNPDGLCVGTAHVGGELRSALVGLRHRAVLAGEDTHFIELVDVFNDFEKGAGLLRARTYLELSRAFAAEFCGRMPEGHPLVYGVPNRRAHRIGLKHLGYEILRSENKLAIPPDGIAPAPASGTTVEEVERLPAGMDGVFARATGEAACAIVRDTSRLNWRFVDHPASRYGIALAGRGGEPTGFAVYRRVTWDGADRGILCDWCVAPEDGETRHALLAWAADRVRADGLTEIEVLFADMSREWSLFQELGFQASGTRDYLVFRSFQKPYVMSWLFENFVYTLSDTQRC